MKILSHFILFFAFLATTSCGVKGAPLPPLKPSEMGHGKPLYRGANKAIDKKENSKDEDKKKDDQ